MTKKLFIFSYNAHIILISRRYTTSYNTHPNTYRDEHELYTKACVTCNYTGTLKSERESSPNRHARNTLRLSRKHESSLRMMRWTARGEPSNWSHLRGPHLLVSCIARGPLSCWECVFTFHCINYTMCNLLQWLKALAVRLGKPGFELI